AVLGPTAARLRHFRPGRRNGGPLITHPPRACGAIATHPIARKALGMKDALVASHGLLFRRKRLARSQILLSSPRAGQISRRSSAHAFLAHGPRDWHPFQEEISHAGNHSARHLDTDAARGTASLAAQSRLGILPVWRSGIDYSHRPDSGAHGTN